MKKNGISTINKEKFLIDECITLHWPHIVNDLKDYVTSVNIVGVGAPDEAVLKAAVKSGRTLVTCDIRLTLNAIIANHKVLFQKQNGKRYFIQGNSKKIKRVCLIDNLTRFLLEQRKIIIP